MCDDKNQVNTLLENMIIKPERLRLAFVSIKLWAEVINTTQMGGVLVPLGKLMEPSRVDAAHGCHGKCD